MRPGEASSWMLEAGVAANRLLAAEAEGGLEVAVFVGRVKKRAGHGSNPRWCDGHTARSPMASYPVS
jgi:hypothetical protein